MLARTNAKRDITSRSQPYPVLGSQGIIQPPLIPDTNTVTVYFFFGGFKIAIAILLSFSC
jgi:hypothetical protein